jgi:hypothetical protein
LFNRTASEEVVGELGGEAVARIRAKAFLYYPAFYFGIFPPDFADNRAAIAPPYAQHATLVHQDGRARPPFVTR